MARLLVVAPNWIGDALMVQPLLARLQQKLPGIHIDALAPAWVAPVLRRMPQVSEVMESGLRHGALDLAARWRLGRTLKARRYQQAFVLPNTWKSALIPFFADIPLRSGYIGESRYGLLNLSYRRRDGEREPMALHYARLSESPGKDPELPLPEPRLNVDAREVAVTVRRFGLGERYAVLCPGAEYGPAKRWPADRFGALAKELNLRGQRVALLGSAADAEVCAEVERAAGGAATQLGGSAGAGSLLNLAARTTLDEAIELIAAADLVVSNDSGLMHVAAALGTPQVAIFGSSSPEHTPPLSAQAQTIWLHPPCSPCYARVCPLGHFRCMNDLTPAHVLSKIPQLGSE